MPAAKNAVLSVLSNGGLWGPMRVFIFIIIAAAAAALAGWEAYQRGWLNGYGKGSTIPEEERAVQAGGGQSSAYRHQSSVNGEPQRRRRDNHRQVAQSNQGRSKPVTGQHMSNRGLAVRRARLKLLSCRAG